MSQGSLGCSRGPQGPVSQGSLGVFRGPQGPDKINNGSLSHFKGASGVTQNESGLALALQGPAAAWLNARRGSFLGWAAA